MPNKSLENIMNRGTYNVTITKVDVTVTRRGDPRFTYTLAVENDDNYRPLTYGLTLYCNRNVTQFDPFWRSFLISLGYTEETVPREELVLTSAQAWEELDPRNSHQYTLDEWFVGKKGCIYYEPDPIKPAWSSIKWLEKRA